MLKLETKQKIMVFRNKTKGGKIYYTASFDSTIKEEGKDRTIYTSLPIKCSKDNFEKLEKLFKNGAKYSVISVDAWLCVYETAVDDLGTITKPAIFVQNIL